MGGYSEWRQVYGTMSTGNTSHLTKTLDNSTRTE